MKIRNRLALRFTLLVGAILLLFAFAVYYFSSNYRQQEFYYRLTEKASNTAKLLIEVDEVSSELLKIIGKNTTTLPEEQIVIYDYSGKELFNTLEDIKPPITIDLFQNIRLKKKVQFFIKKKEGLGLLYHGKSSKYLVFAIAFDKYGYSKLRNLRLVLIVGLLICVIATMIAGWLFSGQAMSPISKVVEEVDEITAFNLSKRVNEGNGTDEIAQLAITFNQMLNRIENAFELQKSFVSNASHELRTPLTSITGQLEVALLKERDTGDYIQTISSALDDIKSLNKLSNGLLDLAHANLNSSKLNVKKVRIDELLWSVQNDLLKRNTHYTININIIDFPEDESKLAVWGSEQLLKSAISNIIENACKFSSDNTCNVDFSAKNNFIDLLFIDFGIGISEEEMINIFEPFYRGKNAKSFPGHGIGISLTQKIIQLHKGDVKINSKLNQFTKVNIILPC